MNNILLLYYNLSNHNYRHGGYKCFKINDPKPRIIHKTFVRDRLLHHAIYRIMYPFFDKTFISDSYSCRLQKGTHRAINRFRDFAYIVSKNNTKTCWVLKCDIKKFFHSINQRILLEILQKYISDKDIIQLLRDIIGSFNSGKIDIGLPLGNLTSQLLSNIYLNELDQFIKHKFKIKYYIRYADDFVILSENKVLLENLITLIQQFLQRELLLELHPNKIFIKTFASGIDFLGWVHFPDYRILRTTTKKRMFRNIKTKKGKEETIRSYLGLLSHGNGWGLRRRVLDQSSSL